MSKVGIQSNIYKTNREITFENVVQIIVHNFDAVNDMIVTNNNVSWKVPKSQNGVSQSPFILSALGFDFDTTVSLEFPAGTTSQAVVCYSKKLQNCNE